MTHKDSANEPRYRFAWNAINVWNSFFFAVPFLFGSTAYFWFMQQIPRSKIKSANCSGISRHFVWICSDGATYICLAHYLLRDTHIESKIDRNVDHFCRMMFHCKGKLCDTHTYASIAEIRVQQTNEWTHKTYTEQHTKSSFIHIHDIQKIRA